MWWARWWAISGAIVLVGGVTAGVLVATGSGSGGGGGSGGSGSSPQQVAASKAKVATDQALALRAEQVQLAAAVTVSPAAGATAVGLDAAVTVSTSSGTLRAVQVTNAAGAVVPGTLSPTHLSWRSGAWLQPATAYRVVATVARPDGVTAQRASTFTTVTPTALVTASVYPYDGMNVGVGQPIVLTFNHYVDTAAAQAAVLSHLSVSMSKPVPGGWHWFSADELHFRPQAYWPAGEKITITGDLDGWDATNGRWGSGKINDSFAIGDARISVANLQTEEMTVTLNGATVGVYPISGGRTQYPTMNGDHIVLDRESVVHMVSSTVGIPVNSANGYDELVYDDVHISDSGEYVHAAPWSVGDQGRTNVSHGCINVSPTNALTFFNFSRVGDVVEVVGGPRPPAVGDHGVMDWSTAWSQWAPAAVHQLA